MELLVVFAMRCLGFSKSSYSLLSIQSYEAVGHFWGERVGGLWFWGTHLRKQSLGVLPALCHWQPARLPGFLGYKCFLPWKLISRGNFSTVFVSWHLSARVVSVALAVSTVVLDTSPWSLELEEMSIQLGQILYSWSRHYFIFPSVSARAASLKIFQMSSLRPFSVGNAFGLVQSRPDQRPMGVCKFSESDENFLLLFSPMDILSLEF